MSFFSSAFSQESRSTIDSLIQAAVDLEIKSPSKSQDQAQKALLLSKESRYENGALQAEIFLCESYTRSKNHQLALFYANAAAKRMDHLGFDLKSKVLRIKAISLGRMGFSDEAHKLLEQAVFYAEKIEIDDNRYENLGYIYANLAENYRDNEIENDSIGYYYQKSYVSFDKINNTNRDKGKHLAFADVNLGTYYLKAKQLDRAQSFFEKALQLSSTFELDFITIEALSGIGSVNYYKKNYKAAQVYYCDGLILARNKNRIFYINDLYYNLLNTYKNLDQKDSSNYYKEKYILLNDSLIKSNKARTAYSLRLFLEEKETKTTNQLVVMLIYIFLVLLVVLIATIYLRKYKRKLKNLKKEVENIDDQLQRKQQLIQQLLNQKRSSESEINELMTLVMNGNPSFFSKFKETHADFIQKIIELAPNIILSELRFCALVKLGFSNVEIATYTKSTIRSVNSRRYRLRKKLNVPVEIDLNDWLKSL